jgi:outer membrane lipoprotein-sorting protein
MKKVTPLVLAGAMILTLTVFPQANTRAQVPGLVSTVINKLESNHRNLSSLRARISMEKYNSQVGESDKYYGVILYVPGKGRNASIRLEWQSPVTDIMAVQNGSYVLYQRRKNQVYSGLVRSGGKSKDASLLELMYLSGKQLMHDYDVQLLGDDNLGGGLSASHLKLVPRSPAGYKYFEIWVDGDGMPVMAKTVEKNDDATTIRLTDVSRNKPVSSDEFKLQLPDGVKRIRS